LINRLLRFVDATERQRLTDAARANDSQHIANQIAANIDVIGRLGILAG